MTAAAVAALGLAGLWLLPRPLAAARWTHRFPRAGIAAWLLLFPATAGALLAAGLAMALHLLPAGPGGGPLDPWGLATSTSAGRRSTASSRARRRRSCWPASSRWR